MDTAQGVRSVCTLSFHSTYHLASTVFFFFFNDTATTEIYTLSLHDALPISSDQPVRSVGHGGGAPRAGTRGGGDGAERTTTVADRGRIPAHRLLRGAVVDRVHRAQPGDHRRAVPDRAVHGRCDAARGQRAGGVRP